MKHPRFIHYWREFWNPRNLMAEGFARRAYQHSQAATEAALMRIERDRQENMPPFWQTYLHLAAHLGLLLIIAGVVLYGLLFAV